MQEMPFQKPKLFPGVAPGTSYKMSPPQKKILAALRKIELIQHIDIVNMA